jgi:flagellar hook-associated protein 2
VEKNLGSVVSLLAGEGEKNGSGKEIQDYLGSMTNASSGMLKGRKDSITSNLKRIDNRITSMEAA